MYYWHQNNYYQPINQDPQPLVQQPYYQGPTNQQLENSYLNQIQYVPYPEQYVYPSNQGEGSQNDQHPYEQYNQQNIKQIPNEEVNKGVKAESPQEKELIQYEHELSYPNANQPIYNVGLLEQLMKQITQLNEKLEEMKSENDELKEQVENIKPINIENINYKIQELTVEELSGNLMIGMTALGEVEDLKKLINEQSNIKFNDIDTENFEDQMEEQE